MNEYKYTYCDPFFMFRIESLSADSTSMAEDAIRKQGIKKYDLWKDGEIPVETNTCKKPLEEPLKYDFYFENNKMRRYLKKYGFPKIGFPLFIIGLLLFYFMESWWKSLGFLCLVIAVLIQPFNRVTFEIIKERKEMLIKRYALSFAYKCKKIDLAKAEKVIVKKMDLLRDGMTNSYYVVYLIINSMPQQIECSSSETSALWFASSIADYAKISFEFIRGSS